MCLGPSDDGGYYLIGVKKPHRHLFEQIRIGAPNACSTHETMRRATEMGIEVQNFYRPGMMLMTPRACAVCATNYSPMRQSSDIAPHTLGISRGVGKAKEIVVAALAAASAERAKWN